MRHQAAALLAAFSLLCGTVQTALPAAAEQPESTETAAVTETSGTTEVTEAAEATAPAETTEATEAAEATEATEPPTEPATEAPEPQEPITVIRRSQEEIRSYIAGHPVDRVQTPKFEILPVYKNPYVMGSLDADSLRNALNALNTVRYIAGVEEVSLSELYMNRAQGAAMVFAVNGSLSYTPAQPAGMSDALFSLCKEGAASSNISKGYTNSAEAILNGYMPCTSSALLAQRRRCLDPRMLETGFGFAKGNDAMYIGDTQRQTDIRGVCWPAQNMPTELFSSEMPWSISMGTKIESAVTVTVTRRGDGKVWTFRTADGTATVDNLAYGQTGCIIFKPDVEVYRDGDIYTVSIQGLETPVSYTVNFFDSGMYDHERETNNPGILVKTHTQDEIRAYIKSHPVSQTLSPAYAVQPILKAPYVLGRLDAVSSLNALNALNIARYIAGVDEVDLSDELSDYAQGAVLVNAVNGTLTHTLTRPAGMNDAMFELCQKGAVSSNISQSADNPASAIWNGFLPDTGAALLSHRRWCLNPAMERTGFGYVDNRSSMYAYDRGGKAPYYGVCWPAQNMPAELFSVGTPWSISMGTKVEASAVTVTMTRMRDGKVWHFSGADGTLSVSNDGYGQVGCISFKPEGVDSYAAGDTFVVSVAGLENPVKYAVNFFKAGITDAAPTPNALGDLNADGVINASDAARILITAAAIGSGNPSGLTSVQATAADVNGDQKINASDAAIILSYAAAVGAGNKNVTLKDFVH